MVFGSCPPRIGAQWDLAARLNPSLFVVPSLGLGSEFPPVSLMSIIFKLSLFVKEGQSFLYRQGSSAAGWAEGTLEPTGLPGDSGAKRLPHATAPPGGGGQGSLGALSTSAGCRAPRDGSSPASAS